MENAGTSYFEIFTKYYQDDPIKEKEMGGILYMHGTENKLIHNLNLEGRPRFRKKSIIKVGLK